MARNCKTCEKEHRYDFYKTSYEHSSIRSKTRKCDTFAYRATICRCVNKKYYTTCSLKKRKCIDYEELSPKFTTNSKLKNF